MLTESDSDRGLLGKQSPLAGSVLTVNHRVGGLIPDSSGLMGLEVCFQSVVFISCENPR